MLFEEIITVTPILMVVILFVLMAFMVVLYITLRKFLVILTVFLFSLVIGGVAIVEFAIPFSPYLQLFFLLFQTIFFMQTSFEYLERG